MTKLYLALEFMQGGYLIKENNFIKRIIVLAFVKI